MVYNNTNLKNVSLFGEVLSDYSRMGSKDIYGHLIGLDTSNNFICCYEFSNVYKLKHGVSTIINLTFHVGLDDSLTDGVSHARDLLNG